VPRDDRPDLREIATQHLPQPSGSSCSPSTVEPVTSQNRTVTTFRAWRGDPGSLGRPNNPNDSTIRANASRATSQLQAGELPAKQQPPSWLVAPLLRARDSDLTSRDAAQRGAAPACRLSIYAVARRPAGGAPGSCCSRSRRCRARSRSFAAPSRSLRADSSSRAAASCFPRSANKAAARSWTSADRSCVAAACSKAATRCGTPGAYARAMQSATESVRAALGPGHDSAPVATRSFGDSELLRPSSPSD
jgi:hypothetical protein